jgi:hypothetical protein
LTQTPKLNEAAGTLEASRYCRFHFVRTFGFGDARSSMVYACLTLPNLQPFATTDFSELCKLRKSCEGHIGPCHAAVVVSSFFFLTWSCWVALEPCRNIIEFHKASRIIDIKSIDTHSSPIPTPMMFKACCLTDGGATASRV